MDDLVDPIHQQPWLEQNTGHLPVSHDLHAVPEAATGLTVSAHLVSVNVNPDRS